MRDNRRLESMDYFKIIAAFFIIAIHTSPLASINASADFIFTRIIARCAVPFFLMVTGYFILSQSLFEKSKDLSRLLRFFKRNLYLYIAAIILYLPVNFYAGHFNDIKTADILRMLIFDGTFYHLWYLPASMLGMLIVLFIGRRFPFKVCLGICLILYFIGLAGDSYYGILSEFPAVSAAYNVMFDIFSYTRNGIFYAPIFLTMGAGIKYIIQNENVTERKRTDNIVGFVISLQLMVIEGMILHYFDMQRHDSMYIALLPCMFFLFQIILDISINPVHRLFGLFRYSHIRYKTLSMWIYIIHPLMIIVVRGIAKITHLEKILVGNSMIHYVFVCIISCLVSLVIELLLQGRIFTCIKKEERG